MPIELTNDQHQALTALAESPPQVVDPHTQQAYVLVTAEQYERGRTLLAADDHLAATYPAQQESAMRGGWDDPKLDAYNDYDVSRKKKLCP